MPDEELESIFSSALHVASLTNKHGDKSSIAQSVWFGMLRFAKHRSDKGIYSKNNSLFSIDHSFLLTLVQQSYGRP
jgi:hypothetical protein